MRRASVALIALLVVVSAVWKKILLSKQIRQFALITLSLIIVIGLFLFAAPFKSASASTLWSQPNGNATGGSALSSSGNTTIIPSPNTNGNPTPIGSIIIVYLTFNNASSIVCTTVTCTVADIGSNTYNFIGQSTNGNLGIVSWYSVTTSQIAFSSSAITITHPTMISRIGKAEAFSGPTISTVTLNSTISSLASINCSSQTFDSTKLQFVIASNSKPDTNEPTWNSPYVLGALSSSTIASGKTPNVKVVHRWYPLNTGATSAAIVTNAASTWVCSTILFSQPADTPTPTPTPTNTPIPPTNTPTPTNTPIPPTNTPTPTNTPIPPTSTPTPTNTPIPPTSTPTPTNTPIPPTSTPTPTNTPNSDGHHCVNPSTPTATPVPGDPFYFALDTYQYCKVLTGA